MKMSNAGRRKWKRLRHGEAAVWDSRTCVCAGGGSHAKPKLLKKKKRKIKFVASVVLENSTLKLCCSHALSPGTAINQSAK